MIHMFEEIVGTSPALQAVPCRLTKIPCSPYYTMKRCITTKNIYDIVTLNVRCLKVFRSALIPWKGSMVGLPSAPRNLGLNDRTIWRVGGIYNGGVLDFEKKSRGHCSALYPVAFRIEIELILKAGD
jgi:hypothetical protein